MAIEDTTKDWADRFAPDITTLEGIAHLAYAALPQEFRTLTANVPIHISEFPSEDITDDLGLESPFDILGLFEGEGASGKWTPGKKSSGNKLTLFRRAILDYWCENDETLHDIITHIIINELGMHYGLSEIQIADIENALD
ncbi:metallopeptidase family protein [Ahrensia marina]|uniref:Zn-dependent protease n=1 Tax=Ahrensia marina TaxID=1514904 RepID=A0A0M9GP87_9HYPH|nr:metallopeptidase family protein [Ahrensia marina]KPB02156.1 Zn-dependent protease [Ahrensia marina]